MKKSRTSGIVFVLREPSRRSLYSGCAQDLDRTWDAGVCGFVDNEKKKILDAIGPFDPSRHQKIPFKLRQHGTGVWFTEGEQFKQWLKSPNAKLSCSSMAFLEQGKPSPT